MEFLFVLLGLLVLIVSCCFYFTREKANYDPETRSYAWETPEVREKNRKAVRAWLAKQRAGRQDFHAAAARTSKAPSKQDASLDDFYEDPEAWVENHPDGEGGYDDPADG